MALVQIRNLVCKANQELLRHSLTSDQKLEVFGEILKIEDQMLGIFIIEPVDKISIAHRWI